MVILKQCSEEKRLHDERDVSQMSSHPEGHGPYSSHCRGAREVWRTLAPSRTTDHKWNRQFQIQMEENVCIRDTEGDLGDLNAILATTSGCGNGTTMIFSTVKPSVPIKKQHGLSSNVGSFKRFLKGTLFLIVVVENE